MVVLNHHQVRMLFGAAVLHMEVAELFSVQHQPVPAPFQVKNPQAVFGPALPVLSAQTGCKASLPPSEEMVDSG